MELSKSEKVLLVIMNEVDVNRISGKIKKVVESYFIKRGWMESNGSFKVNKGGNLCIDYMEKMGWL